MAGIALVLPIIEDASFFHTAFVQSYQLCFSALGYQAPRRKPGRVHLLILFHRQLAARLSKR